ncbi:MAG: FeoB small GTPase domain-containing protein [Anaerolineales bacterium]|nr:FeoB small GTPase domain-containing protein [Anaerolineales bacterium]
MQASLDGLPWIAIVGPPNVGKSLLFNRLTGSYVSVSNYPGTTVEISTGKMKLPCCGQYAGVVDTPGMFSLFPITEEERVARHILLQERPWAVVSVIDAKNLERMLPLTLQLLEADLPLLLALNLLDEAEDLGLEIDANALERRLGVPVTGTVAATGRGIPVLLRRIKGFFHADCCL